MKVLVACEESQRVCVAFRNRGFDAYSCDIQACTGGHPEWHYQCDVREILNDKWDLIIAHPPCTYLTIAGAANIPKHPERITKGIEAASFFMEILNAPCDHVAVENPIPMKLFDLPKYNQIVRPYMFGENNGKPICLWLKNLPQLQPTNVIPLKQEMCVWTYKKTGERKSCSKWYNTNTNDHNRHRSKTFPCIAEAMAQQWGDYLRGEYK